MHILFRYFPSFSCFLNHKATPPSTSTAKMTSLCDKLKHCRKCNQLVRTSHAGQHVCNQVYCRTCNCNVERGEHSCYIKVPFYSRLIYIILSQLLFFSRLRKMMAAREKGRKRERSVSLSSISRRGKTERLIRVNTDLFSNTSPTSALPIDCDDCENSELGTCNNCGENRHVFKGETCLDDFGNWLFSGENRGVVALAHNARGFDSQFLLEYLHRQKTVKPKVATLGLVILMLEAAGVRVIDTLNFLPMALAKFPKTFGIKELKKGYFPHYFNTKTNWDYDGDLPDVEFYAPDSMKEDNRMAFLDCMKRRRRLAKLMLISFWGKVSIFTQLFPQNLYLCSVFV